MGVFIGRRFCFVDEAEHEGGGAKHIFTMAIEWIHLFAREPCCDGSHKVKGDVGAAGEMGILKTIGVLFCDVTTPF